ncbi:hypothetical protein SAMN04488570_1753 [Nocardioides scoriae]|uniref:Polyketide cyclase / dehydrase and lipid transport n=1 Tax=Nocardioides scoriae TaxID=642780 RepID=A0A1H1RR27_9ACTN|nr:hypothetical protein [Nocardioides scoriae]SDS38114.1 hypothetical protein SAMN04488570_1753 [Nocardioides scoriae]
MPLLDPLLARVRAVRAEVRAWNVTAREAHDHHPADRHVPPGGAHFVRAVDVDADPATTWRWLCQLSVAPYSYDLVDNLGRLSPSSLTPGAERLELGQHFLIGPVVELEVGQRVVTAARGLGRRVCGPVAMSYEVVPGRLTRSRILVCLAVGPPRAPLRAADLAWQRLLGAGDLVMMRHQLHRLRGLAEGSSDG